MKHPSSPLPSSRLHSWLFALLGSVLLLVSGLPLTAHAVMGQQASGQSQKANEILVRFSSTTRNHSRQQVLRAAGCTESRRFRLVKGLSLVTIDTGASMDSTLRQLRSSSQVLYAEPNYIVTTMAIPDDPRFGELYGLNNTGQTGGTPDADIDAPEAWDSQTGSDVVVAVIDTGLDYNHEDMVGNVWRNAGEIPNNGIDDDNNGYIDDVRGWDFVNNDNDPFDDNDHGTHVSGTIAAVGNNGIGVAGVNWSARIMPLKFLSARGSGSTADAISALDYAVMMGARISNNSWGGGAFSQALYDTIAAAQTAGHLFVAAAGNDGNNTDVTPSYPASYDLDNIVSVAATDDNDALASFSNFGALSVDLGAPGVSILSTTPANTYSSFSGTSMATPHVAGTAALVLAEDPGLEVTGLKALLMDSVDAIAALAGITVSGGRLNAANAIAALVRVVVTPEATTLAAGTTVQFNATGGTAPYVWSVSDSALASIDATGLLNALAPGELTVTASDANGVSGSASVTISTVQVSPDTASLQIGNTLPFSASGGTAPYAWTVSNPAVASIDAGTGLLTALALGTVQVTATDANGFSDSSGDITVSDIAITPASALLAVGDTRQFSASGGTPPYSWTTGNLAVATIDTSGLLSGVGAGITRVTVTDARGISVTTGDVEVRDILVTPQSATVLIGNTLQFTASGGVAPYAWRVSDGTVASIDASGVLTALAAGTVVVTATDADGISGNSAVITVSADHIIDIVPFTATVSRFGTIRFIAAGGLEPYTWSLSNPAAGSIDPQTGLFRAGRFPATTTVIATDADGHSGESGTITVTRRR